MSRVFESASTYTSVGLQGEVPYVASLPEHWGDLW